MADILRELLTGMPDLFFENGLFRSAVQDKLFQDAYIKLRKKEGRVLSDEQVRLLPWVGTSQKEWKIRNDSAQKLITHLASKNKSLTIVEIGCGNGWLSNLISEKIFCECCAMDINIVELEQAHRVFNANPRLLFVHVNPFQIAFHNSIDIVIFASSIQYFGDLNEVLSHVLTWLTPDGEIHIIDSPVYNLTEMESARQRSKQYFIQLGVPEMTTRYFHHSWSDLSQFRFNVRSRPSRLKRLWSNSSPFPWIVITK